MGQAASALDSLTVGKSPGFARQGEIAADFLAEGVCKAVLIDTAVDWDTHLDNANQHSYYDLLFSGLDNLMNALQTNGILDETLVVVVSEMSRTPQINSNGGKDHWPHASALLMGAGVRGQASLGDYNDLMESMAVSLETGETTESGEIMTYGHFFAGILEHLDIDPQEYIPDTAPLRGFVA